VARIQRRRLLLTSPVLRHLVVVQGSIGTGRVVDFGLVRVHWLPGAEVPAFRVFGVHGIVLGSLEARREARCEVLRDFGRCRIADAGLAAGDVVEGRYDGFEGGM